MPVRPAVNADLDAMRDVAVAVGQEWAAGPAGRGYLRMLLAGAAVRVFTDDGRLLGWGAVRPSPLGSMLTDLFVHPDAHGRGIGGQVLHDLWPDTDAPHRLTFASQHPNALPLYARAGLAPGWPLLFLTGPAPAGRAAAALTVDRVDPGLAATVDHELAGGDRAADYSFWARTEAAHGVVVRGGRSAVAVGVVRAGAVLHLTCVDPQVAVPALSAALLAAGGESVSVCLPGPHPAVISLLRQGFRVSEYDISMTTPDVVLPATWAYSPALA